jgi:hypothetical protein
MKLQIKPTLYLLYALGWLAMTTGIGHAQTTPRTTSTAAPQAQTASSTASSPATERSLKKNTPTGRAGRYFTPGWSLMSAEERKAHEEHMSSITSEEECKSYLAQHHEKMAARAKEKDGKILSKPWRDACGSFKKK